MGGGGGGVGATVGAVPLESAFSRHGTARHGTETPHIADTPNTHHTHAAYYALHLGNCRDGQPNRRVGAARPTEPDISA